jgi:ferredoxin
MADYSSFDTMPRQRPANVDHDEARATFKDLRRDLTEEQIQREAKRCLGCGVTIVDPWMCIGCGLCATKCEFDGISLKKVSEVGPADTPMDYMTDVKNYAMNRNKKIAAKYAAARQGGAE